MIVYIEYVLIDNLVVDYILIKLTLRILGYEPKRARLFLCSLLGAVLALVSPLLYFNAVLLTIYKIISGLLIFVLSTKFLSVKDFYRGVLFFFFITFLTGGAIIGVYNIFNIDYSLEICIATIILPVYLLSRCIESLIKYFYKRKNIESNCFLSKITVKDKSVSLKGFVDTGNMLYDGETPVIIMHLKNAKKFFSILPKVKYIPYQTVAGESKLLVIEKAKIEIYLDKQKHIIKSVSIGVSKQNIGTEYGVILHPDLLKEIEYVRENKKVSKVI